MESFCAKLLEPLVALDAREHCVLRTEGSSFEGQSNWPSEAMSNICALYQGYRYFIVELEFTHFIHVHFTIEPEGSNSGEIQSIEK